MKVYIALLFATMCAACARDTTIGESYLGKPYLNNPLGEGVAPDTDPLIRFDAFDCTTFVETVLADDDVEKLTKIRYKNGVVDFRNRNHFVETDWLPNNSDILTDVTAQYGKTVVRTVKINRAAWLKKLYNIPDSTPIKTVKLNYLPYDNFTTIKNEKPLVVLFVLTGDPYFIKKTGTELAVHHMGFLLPGGILRHASSSAGGVVDVDFYEYVAKRQKSANNLGIMLLEIKK